MLLIYLTTEDTTQNMRMINFMSRLFNVNHFFSLCNQPLLGKDNFKVFEYMYLSLAIYLLLCKLDWQALSRVTAATVPSFSIPLDSSVVEDDTKNGIFTICFSSCLFFQESFLPFCATKFLFCLALPLIWCYEEPKMPFVSFNL